MSEVKQMRGNFDKVTKMLQKVPYRVWVAGFTPSETLSIHAEEGRDRTHQLLASGGAKAPILLTEFT